MINNIVKELNDDSTAKKIGDFLTSTDAFNHCWFPGEQELVRKAVKDSLTGKNHQYWFVEEDEKIIGALGVRENKCGGFEMDADYVAVHKGHRRKGIASLLLNKMENYVDKNDGRYIHILTCDIASYKPARDFYEARGYMKVGEMPNYYSKGEGRIDYYKEMQ